MLPGVAIRVTKVIRCTQAHLWSFFEDEAERT